MPKNKRTVFYRRVRLNDLHQISRDEFELACGICDTIKNIVDHRDDYIKRYNIDPEFAYPDANWSKDGDNDFYDAYRHVLKKEYNIINILRFFTQSFTGYQLRSLSRSEGKKSVEPIPKNLDDILDKSANTPDEPIHKYIAITKSKFLPNYLVCPPKKILGEIGWNINVNTVNSDTYTNQEHINTLYETGIIDKLRHLSEKGQNINILEIGSGYGGLAYHLKSIVPQANYYLCDLPESLLFSSIYLSISSPQFKSIIYDGTDKSILTQDNSAFKFVPNYMLDDLVESKYKIDLVINTISLAEMSEKQIHDYSEKIKDMIGDDGIFFEQNAIFDYSIKNLKTSLSEFFPYRETLVAKSVSLFKREDFADIWSNQPIDKIIAPSFRPFRSSAWKIYWIGYWLTNWSFYKAILHRVKKRAFK